MFCASTRFLHYTNVDCRLIIGLSTLAIIIIVFWGRLAQRLNNHIRHIHNLDASSRKQSYWSQDQSEWWPWIKKNLLYAPLYKKRHHRELQLSKAISVGTLPSRFHTFLIAGYYIMNGIGCAMIDIHADSNVRWAALRGRSGYLAVWNFIVLIPFMARNNPLIPLLKISYDTFQLFHRYIGRLIIIESIIHTFAWAVVARRGYGFSGMVEHLGKSPFLIYGTLGTTAMVLIALHSLPFLRHAFWETFLVSHQILGVAVFIGVYQHLKIGTPPAIASFFVGIIAIWALERSARIFRLMYRNIGLRSWYTQIHVQALPGEDSACRLTFELQRPWRHESGCHVFIYLPRISMWMSHPFSIAWYDTTSQRYDKEELPSNTSEVDLALPSRNSNKISLVVATRTGMTKQLFDKASNAPGGQITIGGFLEGPYGGSMSLKSYGTVLLFAGGVGITHQMTYVRDLLAGWELARVATRKIILVWSIRHTEQLEWVRPWMDEILTMAGRKEVLTISMFVTKPKHRREITSRSERVLMNPGRPNIQQIVTHEIQNRVGAMAVSVCGPGAMADDVREAVRNRMDEATVDFFEEAFTW